MVLRLGFKFPKPFLVYHADKKTTLRKQGKFAILNFLVIKNQLFCFTFIKTVALILLILKTKILKIRYNVYNFCVDDIIVIYLSTCFGNLKPFT